MDTDIFINMTYTVSITSQGQISIPAKIRRELGLEKRKNALVSGENGKMVVESIKDLFELGSSLQTNKKLLSNYELHEIVAKAASENYAAKHKRKKRRTLYV